MQVFETQFRSQQSLLVTSEVHEEIVVILFIPVYQFITLLVEPKPVENKVSLRYDFPGEPFDFAHSGLVLEEFHVDAVVLIAVE